MRRFTAMLWVGGVLLIGCAHAPYVNSIYSGPEPMTPRADTAAVAVFLPEAPPDRAYEVIGQVEVSTVRPNRTADLLMVYAKKRVRAMGGDALVNVTFGTVGGSTSQSTVPLTIAGKTTYYTDQTLTVLRVLRGSVIRWK
jgi:hypothetical protein